MHDGNARSPLAPVFLAGPTAVGKSAVALALAESLGGEIISVDSMQVYRGLDLGTAKPSAAERARVPHHLLDVVELSEAFDAAQFVRLATAAVVEIKLAVASQFSAAAPGCISRHGSKASAKRRPPTRACVQSWR